MKAIGVRNESACSFTHDEPAGATSARGWVKLANHPEATAQAKTCGFWLDYEGQASAFNGATPERQILACAYIFRTIDRRNTKHELGYVWTASAQEAKAFIMGNVRAYFGEPRNGRKEPRTLECAACFEAIDAQAHTHDVQSEDGYEVFRCCSDACARSIEENCQRQAPNYHDDEPEPANFENGRPIK